MLWLAEKKVVGVKDSALRSYLLYRNHAKSPKSKHRDEAVLAMKGRRRGEGRRRREEEKGGEGRRRREEEKEGGEGRKGGEERRRKKKKAGREKALGTLGTLGTCTSESY